MAFMLTNIAPDNWPPIANVSFVSDTSRSGTSTSDFSQQSLIDPNTAGSFSHTNRYLEFNLPIPGVDSASQSSISFSSSSSPGFLFRGEAQNVPSLHYSTNQHSFEASHTTPSAPQSTVAPTTFSTTHFSFRPPQSNGLPAQYELLSYDLVANRPEHVDLPPLVVESLDIPQVFNLAPIPDYASAIASAAFQPQEYPVGYTLQDSPENLSSDEDEDEDEYEDDDWPTSPNDVARASTDASSSSMAPTTRSNPRKKRRSFDKIDKTARKETSHIRKIGACLRCRLQRVRCSDSGPAPDFLCRACENVSKLSKKTIYRIVCCRARINHGILHRSDGLYYTTRFTHTEVVDVGDYGGRILTVEVTQGICQIPIRLRVRRFEPQEGDVIHRKYSENGIVKEQYLQPYCLADVEQTTNDFIAYINNNAFDSLEFAAQDSDELVKATFRMIAKECRAVDDGKDEKAAELHEFLGKFVRMWFALRHESSAGWICGAETLGSQGVGRRPAIPRMIVAQFDSIRHEKVFKVLVPPVLKKMEEFLCSQKPHAWFTVYLASFLLLHQISKCSADRARWARDNASEAMPLETRYGPVNHPFTALVENIQEYAGTVLIHWQFFKKCDPMNMPWRSPGKTQLRCLKGYQLEFMRRSVEMVKRKGRVVPTRPEEGCWDHELFWILQLFGEAPKAGRWCPAERFSRARHMVGLEGGGGGGDVERDEGEGGSGEGGWPYYE